MPFGAIKKFNVYIGYTFRDGSPNTPISTQTAGDNTNRFSGGDMATAINPFVFIGTGKAENMRGKAGSIARDGQQLWFAGGGDLWEDHIDLILAGHTHGGQVRIPFWGAPVLPVGNKAYASGVIRSSKGHTMFISRGIGWAIYPVRFNCFPEIAVVTLV